MSLLATIRRSLCEAEALAVQRYGVERIEFGRNIPAQLAAAAAAIDGLLCHGAFGKTLREMRLTWPIEHFRDALRRGAWESLPDRKAWSDAQDIQPYSDESTFDRLGRSPFDFLLFECYRERRVPSSIFIASAALHYGADPDLMVDGPSTLLHDSALDGDCEFAKLLLDFGADVNLVFIPEERTPLMQAAVRGQADAVELLLARGADPTYCDFDGVSAISLAEQRGYLQIAEKIRRRMS